MNNVGFTCCNGLNKKKRLLLFYLLDKHRNFLGVKSATARTTNIKSGTLIIIMSKVRENIACERERYCLDHSKNKNAI